MSFSNVPRFPRMCHDFLECVMASRINAPRFPGIRQCILECFVACLGPTEFPRVFPCIAECASTRVLTLPEPATRISRPRRAPPAQPPWPSRPQTRPTTTAQVNIPNPGVADFCYFTVPWLNGDRNGEGLVQNGPHIYGMSVGAGYQG